MNANIKSNIAIILSVIAILISTFFGGISGGSQQTVGAEAYLKSVARESGVSSRAYDKCFADETGAKAAQVQANISEAENIAMFAELAGLGTPFNIVMTDTQIIPVSGAYPYEFFNIIINEINTTGSVSEEILSQFQITPIDIAFQSQIRAFDIETDHYRGSENPEIVLIEFSDFECPYCAQIHSTLKQLADENDNFTWVYRHLPLNFHPQAFPAAVASECVAELKGNEAFWNFADTIFANQDKLK